MYPSQFLFEASYQNNKSSKRSQFEIENILRSSFCENSVTAASDVQGRSQQFSFDKLALEEKLEKKFCVFANDGIIVPQESAVRHKFWIKHIRIADDIPGANVLLHLIDDKLELRTVKLISAGDELLLWFSEEILSLMGVPFLTPGNIQGQKAYVCLQCYRSYEVPNQLKIHLARSCDEYEETMLWKRLQSELITRHQKKIMIQTRNFEMLNPYHHAIMPSSSRRFSAFQPVANKCENSPSPPAMPNPNLSPSSHSLNDSALAAAAHLETIVSNMGTSKQGHLCIYCGKLYSRKYGLKIHIRTHTGFKPLKCRHCFRAFGDPSNLNKHIRLHNQHAQPVANDATSYKCHICDKALPKRRDLQRHMQLKHSSSVICSRVDDSSSMTLLSPSSSEEETAE